MAKLPVLLFFCLSAFCVKAQTQSDILLVKKGHRTIRHFFPGSQIEFFTTEHMYVSAAIDSIKRDSLFLTYYDARMVPTMFGSMMLDTVGAYTMAFSFKNVYSFPIRQRGGSSFSNGTLFKIGGFAYLGLNLVNTLREKDPIFGKDNLPHVIGGASAVAVGWLMGKAKRTEQKLGRRYRLLLLPATPVPPTQS